MSKVPFGLAEYDRAAAAAWMVAVDAFLSAYSPWLEHIDREQTENVRTTRVSVKGAPDLVLEPIETDTQGTLPVADIVAGDFTAILDAIDSEALSEAMTLEAGLLERDRSVTDASGNVIDTSGRPLIHDDIRELVERVDREFDAESNPQFEFFVPATPLARSPRCRR